MDNNVNYNNALWIVEDHHFKQFIEALNPNYHQMPCRKTISNAALPRLYAEAVNNVKKF